MSMSLLSALLPPTLAQKPSHPSSYYHSLLLTSLVTLATFILGLPLTEDQSGKDLFDWLLSSDLLPLNNPKHHTLLRLP